MLFNVLAVLSLSTCVYSSPIWRPALAGRGEPATPNATADQSSGAPAGQGAASSSSVVASAGSTVVAQASATSYNTTGNQTATAGCPHGAFQCSGQDLQVCGNGAWTTIQTCTEKQICVMSPYYNCVEQSYVELTNSTTSGTSSSPNASTSAAAGFTGSNSTGLTNSQGNTTSTPGNTTTGGSSSPAGIHTWIAPHRVIYANLASKSESGFPDPDQLGDFNRLIISVYLADGRKAFDNAKAWADMDPQKRQSLLDAYHKRGIAVMLSLFGSTDAPTSKEKCDPAKFADEVANFTLQYGFDGVDADYEDFDAMNAGEAVAWLAPFQKRLREKLPNHLISHAPIAPWFAEDKYEDGAYAGFQKQAGDGVDFYNLQYYNQEGQYEDCESVMVDASKTQYPKTSIKELHEGLGIPLEKLVLGKPVAKGEAASGFMTPNDLGQCFALNDFEWPESLMFWQWKDEEKPSEFLANVLESSDCEEWGYEDGATEASSSAGSASSTPSNTSQPVSSSPPAGLGGLNTTNSASSASSVTGPSASSASGSTASASGASPTATSSSASTASTPASPGTAVNLGAASSAASSSPANSATPSSNAPGVPSPSASTGGSSLSGSRTAASSSAITSSTSSSSLSSTSASTSDSGNWIDPSTSSATSSPAASSSPASTASTVVDASGSASNAPSETHAMPGAS